MDEAKLWAKRLERQADTDLTDEEYAAEIGVLPWQLAMWRRKLRARAGHVVSVVPARVHSPRYTAPARQCKRIGCTAEFVPVSDVHLYCSRRCQRRMAFIRWERRNTEHSGAWR